MSTHNISRRQLGFSMVEIMVAVAIGMIGIVIIFQMLQVWDARKRTATAGGDAQIAGTIAMFNLDRDVKLGGMGFGKAFYPYMGCSVSAHLATHSPVDFTFNLYPVQIVQTAGLPDEIHILYGNSRFMTDTQPFTASTLYSKTTSGRTSFQRGDLVVVTGNPNSGAGTADCQLVEVTDTTNADAKTFDHAVGSYTNSYTGVSGAAKYNANTSLSFSTGNLYNLGPQPQLNIWKIQGAAGREVLVWYDDLHATNPITYTEVAEGVIDLRAEYGIDTDNDNKIATGEWTATAPLNNSSNNSWTKVRAIRVGLLARSQQYEKPDATTGLCTATTDNPFWAGGNFTMKNVDGTAYAASNGPNDWKCYRYRVYDKVIPLRNIVWGTVS